MTFETCLIKKFWPAVDKGDEDEIIRQLVIQAEVALDNSRQVGELYNNMVRGLIRISFLDSLTGEELVLPTATIKPFNIKQKKVRVGKGEDADVVKTEFAAVNIVTRIPDDNEGRLLADLYPFFNIEIQMSIEQLDLFETATTTTGLETDVPVSTVAAHPAVEADQMEDTAEHAQIDADDDETDDGEDDDLYLDDDDDFEDEIVQEDFDQDDDNFINTSDDLDDDRL